MTGSDELERFAERMCAGCDVYGRTAPLSRRIVLALVAEVRAARAEIGRRPSTSDYRMARAETDAALKEQD